MKTVTGIIFFLFLAFAGKAYACTCFTPDLEDAFRQADAVFTGFVVRGEILRSKEPPRSEEGSPYIGKRFHFEVYATFKGKIGKQVELTTGMGMGDCHYRFELGRSYLVFAYGTGTRLTGATCSRTGALDRSSSIQQSREAQEDYNELLKLQKKP